MEHKILVVDDDQTIRTILEKVLTNEGYAVVSAISGEEAVALADREQPDMILLDIGLPGMDGIEALAQIRKDDPDMAAVMITAQGSIASAVAAMKAGAKNYVTKPFNTDELRLIIAEILETVRLKREVQILRDAQKESIDFDRIVSESQAFKRIIQQAQRIAQGETTTVLIEGETGTGKEIIARLIHYRSSRAEDPFVPINCGAIPRDLVESELFGYEKGAFTGATQHRIGKFEAADGGTLFLDEVGELSPDNQIKLLRVLEEKAFYRVGGNKTIRVDVRILAATNCDLSQSVESGNFREDLYYRLNVAVLQIPPLRERIEDIIPLVKRFLQEFSGTFGKSMLRIHPDAEKCLMAYGWKGNVREIRNTIERIILLEDGDTLRADHLDFLWPDQKAGGSVETEGHIFRLPVQGIVLDDLNRDLILQALALTGGNQVRAAKLLGLSRGTLRYRLDKYGIKV